MLRKTLKTLWTAQYGAPAYEVVLDERKMIALHKFKLRRDSKAAKKARIKPDLRNRLESSLMNMFNRTDTLSVGQLKNIANNAWSKISSNDDDNMSNVLFYNRLLNGHTLLGVLLPHNIVV